MTSLRTMQRRGFNRYGEPKAMATKKWTEKELDVLKNVYRKNKGKGYIAEAAKTLNRSKSACSGKIHELKLKGQLDD